LRTDFLYRLAQVRIPVTPAILTLRRSGTPHTVHRYDHDPSAPSFGLEASQALGVDAGRVFKTLLADCGAQPVVAVVPVSRQLDLKLLAGVMGTKKAAMMPAQAAERATGYVVGGISPLGQRRRLQLVLDESALAFATVFVSGGRRGLEIELAPRALVALCKGRTAPISH
jgi:Cys-tRNA(Pro)/Cys-tRNA(Cys) deacylase